MIPAFPPRRIISLVPSITELLAHLGLDTEVAGITKFCVRPSHWRSEKQVIGGTKTPKLERIAALRPDLIIANREENTRSDVEWMSERFPVWVSDVKTLTDALNMIVDVGEMTYRTAEASALSGQIAASFADFAAEPDNRPALRCAYLIWRRPYMSVGGDTFIHDMLKNAGFLNVFAQKTRYPTVSPEELRAVAPDVVFLSSEPFPFKERHMAEIQEICPGTTVMVVDGEIFSWYGSRLLGAPDYFRALKSRLTTN